MEKIYIGLDIGTTAIKLTAVDKTLKVLLEEQYRYNYSSPQKEWTEINPDVWITIVLQGLTKFFRHIAPDKVAGIGITGQMHTTVFVDKDGFPVRHAIMWNDQRTADLLPNIKKRLKKHPESVHISEIVSTGSPLANLVWLKDQEPNNYQKTKKVLLAKDYVRFVLTGKYATDYCDASTSSLYDLKTDGWSKSIQTEFGIDPTILPTIYPASWSIGQLTLEMQKKLKINKGIDVVIGTGDNVAAALISGSFSDNEPLLSLGTSGVVAIPNQHHTLKKVGKNVAVKIKKEDHLILTQGTVQAGAKINSWWMETILHTHKFQNEQEKISKHLLGNNDVLFFPHLNGEKTLYKNPNLRGAFIGLSLETTREAMYLAVLEGLVFGMKQLFEAMKSEEEPNYFTIVGGGAKSPLWVKLFANIFCYPIKRIQSSQEAVHGAAMLAIIGTTGDFKWNADQFEIIYPDNELSEKYQQQYKHYQKLTKLILAYSK